MESKKYMDGIAFEIDGEEIAFYSIYLNDIRFNNSPVSISESDMIYMFSEICNYKGDRY